MGINHVTLIIMKTTIFVYGTLLQGMALAHVLKNSVYLGPAIISANLLNFGNYPGLIKGNGLATGELYQINKYTLKILDEIEGYQTETPERSLYVREIVPVTQLSNGQVVQAHCYFYNGTLKPSATIPHGDYRRYCLEQQFKTKQWVVSYGSNISQTRLEARVGTINAFQLGFLRGYRLKFNKRSATGGQPVANIRYVGKQESCPAVAYHLSADQIEILDGYEGTPNNYLRMSIPFCSNTSRPVIMQIYIAHPKMLVPSAQPDLSYVGYIYQGYQVHGFDETYLQSIIGDIVQ